VDEKRLGWGERTAFVAIAAVLVSGLLVIAGSLLASNTLALVGLGALLVAALLSAVLLYGTAPKRRRFQFGALVVTVASSLAGFLSLWTGFRPGAWVFGVAAIVAGVCVVIGGFLTRTLIGNTRL